VPQTCHLGPSEVGPWPTQAILVRFEFEEDSACLRLFTFFCALQCSRSTSICCASARGCLPPEVGAPSQFHFPKNQNGPLTLAIFSRTPIHPEGDRVPCHPPPPPPVCCRGLARTAVPAHGTASQGAEWSPRPIGGRDTQGRCRWWG